MKTQMKERLLTLKESENWHEFLELGEKMLETQMLLRLGIGFYNEIQ